MRRRKIKRSGRYDKKNPRSKRIHKRLKAARQSGLKSFRTIRSKRARHVCRKGRYARSRCSILRRTSKPIGIARALKRRK